MSVDDFNGLRDKARQRIEHMSVDIASMDENAVKQLVEELQLHQAELEIQNEELRNAQLSIEENKERYISLFNKAPHGYVILDQNGLIKEFNSTFDALFSKQFPSNRDIAFADILVKEDAKIFRARFQSFYKKPENKSFEYRIPGNDENEYFHIQVCGNYHLAKSNTPDDGRHKELLLTITDVTELKEAKQTAETALSESRSREKEVSALLKAAQAVLLQSDFNTTARKIFDICSETIGSTSGYVAMMNERGDENEVLFLEAGGLPCTVDPELPMPIRGLRQEAYNSNQTVYDNDFMDSDWVRFMPKGHVRLDNVMFAPLVIDEKTVGVIGLANKDGDFTDDDAKIAHGFGRMCAIALQNSRNLDLRDEVEHKNANLILELKNALADVKKLSGLLPICAHCKKIRDDNGYWKQIESYIHEHSEAEFSHSICQDCAKKYYPDMDIYEDE